MAEGGQWTPRPFTCTLRRVRTPQIFPVFRSTGAYTGVPLRHGMRGFRVVPSRKQGRRSPHNVGPFRPRRQILPFLHPNPQNPDGFQNRGQVESGYSSKQKEARRSVKGSCGLPPWPSPTLPAYGPTPAGRWMAAIFLGSFRRPIRPEASRQNACLLGSLRRTPRAATLHANLYTHA